MEAAFLFAGSLVTIVVGAELFTNAVEWAGFRLRLASGATGSLLAALGTALPETVVPIVAIVRRQPSSDPVAIGAILGAPFLLLTLGLGVTGTAVAARRSRPRIDIDRHQVRRDLRTFLIGFGLLMVAFLLPQWARVIVAVLLLGLYASYVRSTLHGGAPSEEWPEPLHLVRWRKAKQPALAVIAVQLLIAVGLLIVGAELFVRALEDVATVVRISPLVLSAVLVPVATELPETLNSVLWVRSNDDGLALGNVVGATAFQVCLPGALGVAATAWRPGTLGFVGACVTASAGLYALLLLRDGSTPGWRLILAALPWLGFVALVLAIGGSMGTG